MAAQTEVTRATNLHAAAVADVRRATRDLVNDDVSVAEVVAKALRLIAPFNSFDVIATAEDPVMPETIGKPILYVVQTAASVPDTISGMSGASLDLYLHRPAYAVPLDVDDLGDDLARHAIYGDMQSLGRREAGEVREDRARLAIRGLWLHLPVIGRPNGENMFASTLAGRVAQDLSIGRRGEIASQRSGYSTGSTTAHRAAVDGQGQATAVRVVSTDEHTRERRLTVDMAMVLRSSTVGNGELARGAGAYLDTLVGGCEAGLGRVVTAELLPDRDASKNPSAPLRLAVRITFVSALPSK